MIEKRVDDVVVLSLNWGDHRLTCVHVYRAVDTERLVFDIHRVFRCDVDKLMSRWM